MKRHHDEAPVAAPAAREPIPFSPLPTALCAEAMPCIPAAAEPLQHLDGAPRLSVIVIVYRMPRQAMNTLRSLAAGYQRGVTPADYEVLVVENESAEMLDAAAVAALGPQFRYYARREVEPTPVHAINYAASLARANMIAVMIDGARLLSPGVVSYALAAQRLTRDAIVAVPGYHLGEKLQQEAMLAGYDENVERELLARIDWPADGYRLFEISCLSGTSAGGWFKPMGESNFVAVSRELWHRLGGFDPRFNETGGGQVNLDFYKRACELPDTVPVVLAGEGSFHQFHGGITTGQAGEIRRAIMAAHFAQYAGLRGGPYKPPDKRPIVLGAFPDNAMKTVELAARTVRMARGEV